MNRLNNTFSSIRNDYEEESKGPMSRQTPRVNNSKLHSNITLEMIDDFLNPLSKKKPSEIKQTIQSKCFLPSATNGRGLTSEYFEQQYHDDTASTILSTEIDNMSINSHHTDNYLPFALKQKKTDYNFENIRKSYEKKLYQEASLKAKQEQEQQQHECLSVVGSSMSQIESVTTLSTSTTKKKLLMSRLHKFDQIRLDEEDEDEDSIDLNNNLNKLLDNTKSEIVDEAELERIEFQNRLEELLRNYTYLDKYDEKLPITARRQEILSILESNELGNTFCIIQGNTGCGKTTQVPQYILDHHMKQKKYCNIIVTQPRRIAAVSISRRVCQERGWRLGSFCGYQIGLDRSSISEDTRITYCTTGILLQKLIGPGEEFNFNKKYTHIILDEVHERDLDTDFVMLLIKLKSYGKLNSKIILMSATINKEILKNYYSVKLNSNFNINFEDGQNLNLAYPPVIEIKAKIFNINEFYWDDLASTNSFLAPLLSQLYKEKSDKLKKLYSHSQNSYCYDQRGKIISIDKYKNLKHSIQNLQFTRDEPDMFEEAMLICIALLKYFDEQDLKFAKQSSNYVSDSEDEDDELEFERVNKKKYFRIIDGLPEERGSVLIFVPGMEQIKKLQELISQELPDSNLSILPLHSDIVMSQQNRVFEKTEPTYRKVIISTSIAESSITVPDVKYVIDFCLTKELYCDPYTNFTHLRVEWASMSSLNQRRGRAGRVSDGTCFRLIPRMFLNELSEYPIPAILREPIDKLILNVKRLNRKEEPRQILSMAIQTPNLSDIERTILLLKQVGALSLKCSLNEYDINTPYDGDLTYAGKIMANLPIDVRLSKLILLGHVFGKLRECIIIAAGLSTKTIFTCYYKSHLESFKAKWNWSEGWMCDCLTLLNAYNLYESLLNSGGFDKPGTAERWTRMHMIELNRIREVEKLVNELKSRLADLNIFSNHETKINSRGNKKSSSGYDIDDQDDLVKGNLILKLIIAGAFYPNYFNGIKIDLEECMKMSGGRDFKNMVQLKNLPLNEGVLYTEKIKDVFKVCSNMIHVSYEDSKAYVEFKSKHDHVASNVNLGVYLAVQMRLLRIPLNIKRFNPKLTIEKLNEFKLNTSNASKILTHSFDSNRGLRFNLNESHLSLENSEDDQRTIVNSDEELDNLDDYLLEPERFQTKKNTKNYLSILSLDQSELNNSLNQSMISNRSSSSRISTSIDKSCLIKYLSDPKYILPVEVDQNKLVKIIITEVIECGNFWAQIADSYHVNTNKYIHKTLNNNNYNKVCLKTHEIQTDVLCVTHFIDSDCGEALYRAKIVSINTKESKARVLFIDYGNMETKHFRDLYVLCDDLVQYPYQAIECKMMNIKPCLITNPNGTWTKKSNDYFANLILNNDNFQKLKIKCLGVLNNETNHQVLVDLYGFNESNEELNISDLLVLKNYAKKLNSTENDLNMRKIKFYNNTSYYIPSRESDFTTTKPIYYNEPIQTSSKRLQQQQQQHNESILSDISSISESCINTKEENYNESDYSGYIELRGPYSPLECSFHSILNIGQRKKVRVERDSINYVTIDDDPANEANRLLVAHEVSLNTEGSTMILRKTTLMPKIAGLSGICCLLFSPAIEMRTDSRGTIYTGALCGLGYDEYTRAPIYTDNDIECVFDVKIDPTDLITINSVRMVINLIIGSEENAQTWTHDCVNLRKLQQTACDRLMKLINRNRDPIEPKYFQRPHKWNQVSKDKLIDLLPENSAKELNNKNNQVYYSYHRAVALNC